VQRFCAELTDSTRTLCIIRTNCLISPKTFPLIVEVVASQDKLEAVMPEIDPMMNGGLMTFEKLQVMRYCDKNDAVLRGT
jgi:PII-like signaling protein